MTYFQEAKVYFAECHQHPINQLLHHITNMLAIASPIILFYDWRLTMVCLVLTQVLAIGGHFIFEKNQPAFAKYPVWVTIPTSLMWSFQRWFGLRQVWQYLQQKTA